MVPSVKLNNGADMPIIGFGTTFVSEAAVECALTTGFRLFDTAYDYGTEHVLGKVFQKWLRLKKISREELFVITKVPPHGNRPEGIEKYLRRSLQKLCLDYVDMYLIHWPVAFKEVGEEGKESLFPKDQDGNIMLDLSLNHIEVWRAMEAQVDAGRAKAIGLSNFNISQIQRILKAARIPPANLQCEIHIYHQQHELVDYCKKCGIVVCGYFPLGGHTITLFSASERWHQALIDEPVIRRLAEKYKKTPPQILIRYSIDRGVVTIFGCGNKPEYIAENFQVLTFKISHEDMLMLNRLDKGSEGRRVDLMFVSGIAEHPEYPFER